MSLDQQLTEAREALHLLMISKEVVRIRSGDDWVEYHPKDAAALRLYIQELQSRKGRVSLTVRY